ncbi:gasdermin-D isoform X2 [Sorex fumeus]|uniref:gasdermin-D isoform X2 n=1 Tax=Sorex fumeus TaxID=62283 RepID=UPI0024ACAC26|nr:gasdermin-D isoform X2 [Sorex fumeus]
MASAFNGVVRSVIRELDPRRELSTVDSLESASGFQPYHLLMKKLSRQWFGQSRYSCINLSIQDILEGGGSEPPSLPAPRLVGTFHFLNLVDGQLQGSVELAAASQGMLKAGASMSNSSSASMHVAKLQVDPRTWTALQQETRLQNPEPKILQQLRQYGVNVYVVTEVLRTEEEGKGQGHLSSKTTVTIPSGSILAFRAALLVIDSESRGWDVILFPEKKQKTFVPNQADVLFSQCQGSQGSKMSDRVTGTKTETVKGFRLLEMEAEDQAEGLCVLSRELCRQLLRGLDTVLRDEAALLAFEEALEQGMCLGHVEKQDGPVGTILECLVKSSRELAEELTKHAVYLLGALSALSAAQRALLAQELQARALSEPLSLVRSLLKQADPWQQGREVTLPAGPLGSRWREGAPAWILLEHCGLRLQENAPQVHWVPEALDTVHALYACLVVLSRLSQDL